MNNIIAIYIAHRELVRVRVLVIRCCQYLNHRLAVDEFRHVLVVVEAAVYSLRVRLKDAAGVRVGVFEHFVQRPGFRGEVSPFGFVRFTVSF